jgi:hypothetical protein
MYNRDKRLSFLLTVKETIKEIMRQHLLQCTLNLRLAIVQTPIAPTICNIVEVRGHTIVKGIIAVAITLLRLTIVRGILCSSSRSSKVNYHMV